MTELWVWVDLELTGLDLAKDAIIEIAVMITDSSCRVVAEGPDIVIATERALLETMDPFVHNMHAVSGLTEEVLKSTVSLQDATEAVLEFLQRHGVSRGIIAGNSVHQDRLFMLRHMPALFESALHPFRVVDVTALKELFLAWRPQIRFAKAENHRSKEDIMNSLKELQFYLHHLS